MNKTSINWTNMLLFSLTPALAIILVPLYGYLYGYDLYEWLVFIGLMGFCGMSITAGYHRLWSHKTYKAYPILRAIFAIILVDPSAASGFPTLAGYFVTTRAAPKISPMLRI